MLVQRAHPWRWEFLKSVVGVSAIAGLAVLVAAPASAEDPQTSRLAECAVLPRDERLACYDALAADAGHRPADIALPAGASSPPLIEQPTNETGKWQLNRMSNPLDDTETVFLTLDADSGRAGYENRLVRLIARCKSNETEVYVNWNVFLGDDSHDVYNDWKEVTVRIGEGKAQVQRWSVSTDNEATFAPNWPGELLKKMLGADHLVLQVTPFSENPVTAEFDLRGLSSVLGPLAEACGWTFEGG